MRNNKKLSFSTLLILIVLFNILSEASYMFSGLGRFFINVLLPIGIISLIVLILVMLISSMKGNNKTAKKEKIKVDLIELINKKKLNGKKIVIDETTYLICDKDKCSLENVDIYMNDEYVGTLAQFSHIYPNAYNDLSDKLVKQLKRNKNESIIEEIKEKVVEKDINYYINQFISLNEAIDNEEVKKQIDETIVSLRQIKSVEDEFPESKKKSYKLYEYYLPMYADILANYDRLSDSAPQSNEFKESEGKLLKTSNLINTALISLLNSLTETYTTDLNVNMKTLESVLKKDGLINESLGSNHGQQ